MLRRDSIFDRDFREHFLKIQHLSSDPNEAKGQALERSRGKELQPEG